MNIDVGKYNITSDLRCIAVNERYKKENGDEGLRFIGYYSNMPSAIRGISKVVVKTSNAKAVQELSVILTAHEETIAGLINSADLEAYRTDKLEEAAQEKEELSFLD